MLRAFLLSPNGIPARMECGFNGLRPEHASTQVPWWDYHLTTRTDCQSLPFSALAFLFFFSGLTATSPVFSLPPFFITIPFFFCVFCHIRVVYSWLSCMRFGAFFFFLSFFFLFVLVRLERITEAQGEAARNSVECACVCVCVRNKKKTNNSSVVASTSDSVSTLYPLFLFFT